MFGHELVLVLPTKNNSSTNREVGRIDFHIQDFYF